MPVRAPKGPAQARRVWPRDPPDTWVPARAIGADKPCRYLPAAPLDRFGRYSFGRRSLSHEQGYAWEVILDRTAQAAVNRTALRRALVAHGLLRLTSRGVPEGL